MIARCRKVAGFFSFRRYTMAMPATATIDSTAGTFTLTKGVWSGTFPIADLPKWLGFYRRQQELFPNHAAAYDDDLKALEALAR